MLASKGGVNYENGQMGIRGPHKLNVTLVPGIVKDPGHAVPQIDLARGINLDGDDGKGAPPPGTCKHKNYVSEDGRTGIDNQLYTAQGCIAGFQGHKGFVLQFANNQMRDGQMSILVTIGGIDDEQNDDKVDVTVAYSLDPMAKSGSGSEVLSDYTFRITDNPEYTYFFSRVPRQDRQRSRDHGPDDGVSLELGCIWHTASLGAGGRTDAAGVAARRHAQGRRGRLS